MKKLNIKSALLALTLMGTLVSCDTEYNDETPSIAGIAVANPNFSTLEAAAVQGGVVGVLSNSNPNDASGHYTVFAPTNDAFARLGLVDAGSLGALQTSFLTNTLLYHVSNGDLLASGIAAGGTSTSALGLDRRFISRGDDLYINGSKIVLTDVSASNGTVHAIDKVMIATGVNIVDSAILLKESKVFTSPELTFLVQAVITSGLATTLSDADADFTIYAPTDAAFKAAGFATVDDVANTSPEVLQQVLLNHAIVGSKFTSEYSGTTAATAGGGTLTYGAFTDGVFTIKSNGITTPANMVIPDIQCSNGIVHIIDTVLLP
jgi:uncharacterized surface protein with fasciclin (FAS1) repeats